MNRSRKAKDIAEAWELGNEEGYSKKNHFKKALITYKMSIMQLFIIACILYSANAWNWPWSCSDKDMVSFSTDGELASVKDCLSRGSNVNAEYQGDTALIFASYKGHLRS